LNFANRVDTLPPVLKNNQLIDDAIKKILNQNNMTQSKTSNHFAKVLDTPF